jgi:tRNA A-37 threonylcarbamoyl transferase component Bud32
VSESAPVAAGAWRCLWLAPELSGWRGSLDGEELPSSAGRGAIQRARVASFDAIVRTYRRGGALRALLPDAFLSATRALAEVHALTRLAALGLAPRPLVLEARGRVLLRLRIAVEEVARSRNLLELAAAAPASLDARLGRAVGQAVRAMHDAGVAHPDLNAGNILITDGPALSVSLIDFDGARIFDAGVPRQERAREILRLARSLDKWPATRRTSAAARAAFLRAALPRGERGLLLREARRRARAPSDAGLSEGSAPPS